MPTSKKPTSSQDEHMALDAAMNELAKQTDELLKKTKPAKPAKPKLPAKKTASSAEKKTKVIPHTKGAHLDIMNHTPSSVRKNVSSAPAQKLLEETTEDDAPAAIKSEDIPKIPEVKSASVANATIKPSIIKSHVGKQIEPPSSSPAKAVDSEPEHESASEESAAAKSTDGAASAEHIKVDDKEKAEKISVSHPSPQASKPESKEHSSVADSEEEPIPKIEKTTMQTKRAVTPEVTEPDSKPASAEDEPKVDNEEDSEYDEADDDDGIVKIKDKEEKKTSYDIAEYQAQLHDWSKLSSNSHWSFVILVLLLAVAGGLMYLYFTNQLPTFF